MKRGLQKKGTRSAKRKLKRTAGKERRFQKDQNHCISKDILKNMKINSTIILEDLSEIRKSAKQRKKTRGSRELNSWAFYQFQIFLQYKGKEKTIQVVYINPTYTHNDVVFVDLFQRKIVIEPTLLVSAVDLI